jgi:UDP-N-acetyl-D-glucosamine dehydrogenase
MKSKPLTPAMIKSYDCVLIATDHSSYDYQWIVDHAQLVVDTRNATRDCKRGLRKVVRA